MLEIRPVLEKVVTDVCAAVCPRTMVVADLCAAQQEDGHGSTLCGWIARLVLHKAFSWPYRPFLPFLLQPHVALPGILPTQCPSLAEDPYVVLSYVEVFSLILLCSYQQSCRLIAKYT